MILLIYSLQNVKLTIITKKIFLVQFVCFLYILNF